MHSTQQARVATFEGRQDLLPAAIENLAAAGFCWTPFSKYPGAVRCEDCEIILKVWPASKGAIDPVVVHKEASPNCAFLARNGQKGQSSALIDLESFSIDASNNSNQRPVLSCTMRDLMQVFPVSTVTASSLTVPTTPINETLAEKLVAIKTVDEGGIQDKKEGDTLAKDMGNGPPRPLQRLLPEELRTCRYCDRLFDSRDVMMQHSFTNCGKNPELCPSSIFCRVCKKNFETRHELKIHLKSWHEIELWY